MNQLRRIREARKLTLEAVAERLATTAVSISRYERVDQKLTLPLMRRFAKALNTTVAEIAGEQLPEAESEGMVRVPELDVRATAGQGHGLVEVNDGHESDARVAYHGFPASGFREVYGTAPESVRVLSVVGDSMSPELRPGQKILVDLNDRMPSPPGIFVLWDGLGNVIKRVEHIAHSDPPTVRISSDNPRYAAFERSLEEAYIQGRVIGKWDRT
jgi:transcriptional regulator with XRE-family HTH domain